MKALFVKGFRSKLDDVEYVEQKLKKTLPYTYQSVVYKIIEAQQRGAFRHITVEYGHSDNVTTGPISE